MTTASSFIEPDARGTTRGRLSSGLDLFTDFPFVELDEQRAFVSQAKSTGYSGVLATENHHDPFLPIAASAKRSMQLTVGTAVVTVLAHNPFTLAQKAWDLHYNSGEHFILGICTHQDVHLTHRLGISAEQKHERLIEAVHTIREIWASWMEDRDPAFTGKYYSIHVCPPAYRPTTRIQTLPEIYLLCAVEEDLEIAPLVADGIFTHPTWNREYLDRFVLPRLDLGLTDARCRIHESDFRIIDASVIATGENYRQLQESRHCARQRIAGYWVQSNYDAVFDHLGLTDPIRRFRAETQSGKIPWEEPYLQELYAAFVCDALFENLGSRLRARHSTHVTGLFPNIMSAIPRLLPADLVAEIRNPEIGRMTTPKGDE